MSWIRANLLYVIIVILVLFLLLLTIQLQYLMLQVQPGAQPPTGAQVVTVAALVTPTPLAGTPIVLLATPLLPTATPVPPTATPTLPPTATFTATPLPPTATPTSAPLAPATATSPPLPPVDFRLGYVDRGDDCPGITTIVQTILEKELGYQVATVAFTTPDELFAMLTADDGEQKIDWTMCYLDPADRPFLQKYGGFFVVIGGIYWRNAGNNYQIMANGLRKQALQQEQPCVYEFLKNFTLEDAGPSGQEAATWVAEHQGLVRSWTSCR